MNNYYADKLNAQSLFQVYDTAIPRIKQYLDAEIDFVRQNQANVIVRGLRAITDFEYELQMAQTNRVIAPEIDTIFLTTNLKYSYLSSSIVKEIAEFNGDIKEFLHPIVVERVKEKLEEMKNV